MPRDAGGTFTLVVGNPVVGGTIITSTWANNTMGDVAAEMTDSLSRSGQGGMLTIFKLTDGSASTPSMTFNNDPTAGVYRSVAGAVGLSQGGAVKLLTAGNGVTVLGTGVTSNPPAASDTPATNMALHDANGVLLGDVGYLNNSSFTLNSYVRGATIALQGAQADGTLVAAVVMIPDVNTKIVHKGLEKVRTDDTGIQVRGSVNAANPPTNEAVDTQVNLLSADGTALAYVGYAGDNAFTLAGLMRGGLVVLGVTGASGAQQDVVVGNADGSTDQHYAGVLKTSTAAPGLNVRGSVTTANPPTGEAVDTQLGLLDASGVEQLGLIGFNSSNALQVTNRMQGGLIEAWGEKTGGGASRIFAASPDATLDLYAAGINTAQVVPAAQGGLLIANGVTGGGSLERGLTVSDLDPAAFFLKAFGAMIDENYPTPGFQGFNIALITRLTQGSFRVDFTTPMADANYTVTHSFNRLNVTGTSTITESKSTTSFEIRLTTSSGALVDNGFDFTVYSVT